MPYWEKPKPDEIVISDDEIAQKIIRELKEEIAKLQKIIVGLEEKGLNYYSESTREIQRLMYNMTANNPPYKLLSK